LFDSHRESGEGTLESRNLGIMSDQVPTKSHSR
jgi:hypothetical protein